MTSLHIQDLNLWYGRSHILKNVSLPPFLPGHMVGLIGPNAAGKSSLLQTLIWPKKSKQTVTLNDTDLGDFSPKQRSQLLGLMTQTPPQPSLLTPYELLYSLARALDLPLTDQGLEQRIETLFKTFGLTDVALSPLQTLSGGKRQLVGVAMVLLRSPEVCLLDEPTSALDLHWRLIVLQELQNYIRQDKKIALVAIHDLSLVTRFFDRLVLLDQGQVVATGTPQEVLTQENIAQVFKVKAKLNTGENDNISIEILDPLTNETY